MTVYAMLAALIAPRREHQPRSHAAKLRRTIAVIGIWLAVVYTVAILNLWLAWDAMIWGGYWIITGCTLLALPAVYLIRQRLNRSRYTALSGSQLREVLLHADDRLAPPISIQPVSAPVSSEDERLGPFVNSLMPNDATQGQVYSVAIILPAGIVMFLFLLDLMFPEPPTLLLFITIGALGIFFIDMIVFIIWAIRSSSKRLTVTVNNSGITWQYGTSSQAQHMDWSQARALLRITATSSSSSSTVMIHYLLISTDVVLMWSLPGKPDAQILSDSERLLGVISAHTQLPLRNVTKFAGTLSGAGKSTRRLLEYYGLSMQVTVDPWGALPSQPTTTIRIGQIMGIVATVLLASLPVLAGGWMQSYSSAYLHSLDQRIITETPLYGNTLAYEDGNWPNIAASGHFVHASYEIHNSGNTGPQTALLSGYTFGSARYSVMTTESGAVPNDAEDGIGLAFHVNSDATEYVTFTVKYDGEWELRYYSPTVSYGEEYLDSAFSNAVYQGPGATNTLSIVTYSHSALIFINDQFIKLYTPESFDHVDLTQTGAVGVYLNSAAMTGDFSNFIVSPAPPIDFWDVMRSMPPWSR